MVRTENNIVAPSTRWKICWIFVPYSSWSVIFKNWDLLARSSNSFISFPRVLDGDKFLMICNWCTTDDVLFEVLHRLFGGLRNTTNYHPFHSQESLCRFFETYKLTFVASNLLM